jgi:uncharacterized membrane protein
VGGFLRFYNLNWDLGFTFHPDERNIANAITKISLFKQLNPEFFAYGGFTIYLYRAVGEILTFITKDSSWIAHWGKINLIGRFISALFSSLTIPLVYIAGKKMFSKKVGIIASVLIAFSPSLIQTAHFAVTESFLAFFVILILLSSLNLKQSSLKKYIKSGFLLGISIAAKTAALSFLVIPVTACVLWTKKKTFWKRSLLFLALLGTAILVFTIFSPYTFLDWGKFMESMKYESGVATGRLPVPYTLQFTNTFPYLFQLKNLFWQFGSVTIFGILGIIWLIFTFSRRKEKKIAIFLIFPVVYFLYVGSWHTKFIRYMVPILPFIGISAAYLLSKTQNLSFKLGRLLIFVIIFSNVVWGLAFFSIYLRPQTRIVASEWIYQNIPSGSKIYTEHWDDGLPVNLPKSNRGKYEIEELTIYEPDNSQKIDYFSEKLSKGNYVILSSRRLWGTLINLEEKYPITSRYYKLLFSGKLGYQKVAEFSSYPKILGIQINDGSSEETFQVYDHPTVFIFKKTKLLSSEEIKSFLFKKL